MSDDDDEVDIDDLLNSSREEDVRFHYVNNIDYQVARVYTEADIPDRIEEIKLQKKLEGEVHLSHSKVYNDQRKQFHA